MPQDFIVFATRTGWSLRVAGETTAILEHETRDDAVRFGFAVASRKGVKLYVQKAEDETLSLWGQQ
ncbi:DUF2188 domain-containing protein [Cupriavidus sp. D39]|uniref:DUF2188 domain-containing protein n=1 Tax=Cupriavidus sp. D39 TaxID=2997877 RepID=UPI003B64039F